MFCTPVHDMECFTHPMSSIHYVQTRVVHHLFPEKVVGRIDFDKPASRESM